MDINSDISSYRRYFCVINYSLLWRVKPLKHLGAVDHLTNRVPFFICATIMFRPVTFHFLESNVHSHLREGRSLIIIMTRLIFTTSSKTQGPFSQQLHVEIGLNVSSDFGPRAVVPTNWTITSLLLHLRFVHVSPIV